MRLVSCSFVLFISVLFFYATSGYASIVHVTGTAEAQHNSPGSVFVIGNELSFSFDIDTNTPATNILEVESVNYTSVTYENAVSNFVVLINGIEISGTASVSISEQESVSHTQGYYMSDIERNTVAFGDSGGYLDGFQFNLAQPDTSQTTVDLPFGYSPIELFTFKEMKLRLYNSSWRGSFAILEFEITSISPTLAVAAVPIPTAAWLFASALGGLGLLRTRQT